MSKKSLHIKASKEFEQEFALLGLQTPFKIKGNLMGSKANAQQETSKVKYLCSQLSQAESFFHSDLFNEMMKNI